MAAVAGSLRSWKACTEKGQEAGGRDKKGLRRLGSECVCQSTNDRGYGSGHCVAVAGVGIVGAGLGVAAADGVGGVGAGLQMAAVDGIAQGAG